MSGNAPQQQQEGGLLDAAQKAAGVVGGHAQLASGAAQEQIGNMSGSDDWKKSGQDVKDQAGSNIKQAFEEFQQETGDSAAANKASALADKACPETGSGLGSQQ